MKSDFMSKWLKSRLNINPKNARSYKRGHKAIHPHHSFLTLLTINMYPNASSPLSKPLKKYPTRGHFSACGVMWYATSHGLGPINWIRKKIKMMENHEDKAAKIKKLADFFEANFGVFLTFDPRVKQYPILAHLFHEASPQPAIRNQSANPAGRRAICNIKPKQLVRVFQKMTC